MIKMPWFIDRFKRNLALFRDFSRPSSTANLFYCRSSTHFTGLFVQQSLNVLAALSGIRLAAYLVHGLCQSCMSLDRYGTETHGAGGEPSHDTRGRLDLTQINALAARIVDLELASYGAKPIGLGVQLAELLVCLSRVLLSGLL